MTRGRFAPSPTGALHFGTLVAAVASYLNAKTVGAVPSHRDAGQWLIRMEDLDPPREVPGAADNIIAALERLGFEWDGPVLYQSTRGEAYAVALKQLIDASHAYPCACSRREIADSGLHGIEGPVYPGTCRNGLPPGREGRAWRLRTGNDPVGFQDLVQGPVEQVLERDIGDFIVRRGDGYWAYQLAVVIDDAAQGITEVVRGTDLLASTPRQIWLQHLLGLPTPAYLHFPVALDVDGHKLSKSGGALATGDDPAALWAALDFLGQSPPADLRGAPPDAVWSWAFENWYAEKIPRENTLPAPKGVSG